MLNIHKCTTLAELQQILKSVEEADEAKKRFQDSKKRNGGGCNQSGNSGGGNQQYDNGANDGNGNNDQRETQEKSRAVNRATIINGGIVLITDMKITIKVTRATQQNARLGINLVQKDRCDSRMIIAVT